VTHRPRGHAANVKHDRIRLANCYDRRYPIDAFLADIGDMMVSVEPTELKRKSRGFVWHSPILDSILVDKFADVIIMPWGEDDVLPVASACARHRIDQIIRDHEPAGIMVANPHVYTLEDGSRRKRVDTDQFGFKHDVDPPGLLDPGRMRSFIPR
jgi:hypothetical protein